MELEAKRREPGWSMAQRADFRRYISIIMRAVWDDKKALAMIGKRMVATSLDDNGFWPKWAHRNGEIVRRKLSELVEIQACTTKKITKENQRKRDELTKKIHHL